MINYVVVLVYVWQKIKIKKISRHELKKLETWKLKKEANDLYRTAGYSCPVLNCPVLHLQPCKF